MAKKDFGSVGFTNTDPTLPGVGFDVTPNKVSELPRLIPTSPAFDSPSPASEHGLSPDDATTLHLSLKNSYRLVR
jgi:hypothetical protein